MLTEGEYLQTLCTGEEPSLFLTFSLPMNYCNLESGLFVPTAYPFVITIHHHPPSTYSFLLSSSPPPLIPSSPLPLLPSSPSPLILLPPSPSLSLPLSSPPPLIILPPSLFLSFLQVGASDADSGELGRVTYEIFLGDAGGVFAIGNETGEVWVVGPLDKETVDQYTLTILAEDGGETVVTAGGYML